MYILPREERFGIYYMLFIDQILCNLKHVFKALMENLQY